ncbi:hypothetical protein D7V88_42055, partial [Corallococcus terminator]
FYGAAAVPVAADATDANGLVSHALTGLPGAATSGLQHLVGSWSPAANNGDGPVTATFKACDVVGNCTSKPAAFALDRTPPVLSFAVTPPPYTNANTVTLTVSPADVGAGVTGIFGRRSGALTETVSATRNGNGTWSVTLPAVVDTSTTYFVWGVDAALPANSGLTVPVAPYLIKTDIRRDTVAPTVELLADSAGGSYRS